MQDVKNGRTILVAEDELEVRGYLEMALKCLGYSVELAQDGDEVLACLQSSRSDFAAILLDIMMPNRDGIDTLREIRRMNPDIPVIVVSGASSPLNIVTAMKNGGTDFLCKPVAHEDLRKAITRALESKGTEYVPASRNTAPVTRAFRRPQSSDEGNPGADRADRLVRTAGPDPGRNRQRQGSDCARTACPIAARVTNRS